LPAHLRIETVVDVPDQTCACRADKRRKTGKDVAEQLDAVRSKLRGS